MQGILIDYETGEVSTNEIGHLRRLRCQRRSFGGENETLSASGDRNGAPWEPLIRCPGVLFCNLFAELARGLQGKQLGGERVIGCLQVEQLRVQVGDGDVGRELAGK